VTGESGNGRVHEFEAAVDDAQDDDAPLDATEEAAAAAEALAEADETLDERVEAVVEELDGAERRRDGIAVTYLVSGRTFAVLAGDVLEVSLDPVVGSAALRTPGTRALPGKAGWVAFAPATIDRFALDRAEAWLRSAYRRAAGG
jgi:hypothetical protein